MFWVIVAVVLIGFGALVWWWSGTGESTPSRPGDSTSDGDDARP